MLVVDDHTLFAQALCSALQSRGLSLVGVAGDGERALEIASLTRPDIVLMDIGLPDRDGISIAKDLMTFVAGCKIIALTATEDVRTRKEAAQAGLLGYLLKGTNLDMLVTSIETVHRGGVVFGSEALVGSAIGRPRAAEPVDLLLGLLTMREQQVLSLLGQGVPSRGISERLNLSISTVRTHIQTILGKLQVHSRLEAVAYARHHDSTLTASGFAGRLSSRGGPPLPASG